MTSEEQAEFKEKIKETIMPIASSMTEEQIQTLVFTVESENPNLPEGFANMLYEQIILFKYKALQ